MYKILLINPSQIFYSRTFRASSHGSIGVPVGLLSIAAALEGRGCEVDVLDCLVSEHSVFEGGKNFTRYGIPSDTLKGLISGSKPDLVGISSQFTTQEESVLDTAQLVKAVDSSVKVVVGGANVACRGRHLVESGCIDVAVRSEAEDTINEVVDSLRGRRQLRTVKGIIYKEADCVVDTGCRPFIDDLDCLPLPAYHLVDMERYLTLHEHGIFSRERGIERAIPLVTSRGCPFNCVFCSISQTMGKKWRPQSPQYVIRHLEELSSKYGVRHIHFEDDNLLLDLKRFEPVMDALMRLKLTWDTPNGVRVDLSIDETMLRRMKSSGCRSLSVGVESGDQHILDEVVKKGICLPEVVEFAKRCNQVRLPLKAFFIIGFPGETRATMQKTIDFALSLMDCYGVEPVNLIATPIYGTRLHDLCVEHDCLSCELTPKALSESTVSDGICLIRTESFREEDVELLSRKFTSKVYWRLLLKDPLGSARRIGNIYSLKRIIRRTMYF